MNDAAEAFLAAIVAAPDDDGPRLVYADWLEERGESERSEFIRCQIELAAVPSHWKGHQWFEGRENRLRRRERELLEADYNQKIPGMVWPIKNIRGWWGFLELTCGHDFRRGFVEKITCSAADRIHKQAELLARAAERADG